MAIKAHLLRCASRPLSAAYLSSTPRSGLAVRLASGTFLTMLLAFSNLVFSAEIYHGPQSSLSLGGHYKNLIFTSKRQATDDPYAAELQRIRLEADAKWRILSAKVAWDNELLNGDFLQTEEFAGRQMRRNEPYPDMDYQLARTDDFYYGQNLYRAYLKMDAPRISATLGRQRVDWGVMRIEPVADLFVRPPVFDIEKDEFVAPTAANLLIPLGPFKINPVYTLESDFDRSRTGLRVTRTVGRYDLSVFGGRFLKDTIGGHDFEGDFYDIGIRGELLRDWAGVGGDFFQAAVGADYGFPNSLYFALEYFFNGQGTGSAALPFPATAPFLQTVHRHFIGFETKYDLTPLWKVLLLSQTDPAGGSVLLYPELSYTLFEWMEVSGSGIFPVGKAGGEFTAVPNLYQFQAQLFF